MKRSLDKIYPTVFIGIAFLVISCKEKKGEEATTPTTTTPTGSGLPALNNSTTVKGYDMLAKLCGIWNGPVTSSTPLGSYPEWIVDFRPISASQVSSKSELDTLNDIFMSFFIVYHKGEYKIALRNGGSFNGAKRVAYAAIDSVSETSASSFYRFSDFVKGKNRVYTEVTFKTDSLEIKTYTNKYNTLSAPTIHMDWKAKLQYSNSAQAAISNFGFPQKTLVKDFSSTFSSSKESIYYSFAGDPYAEADQPYVGQTKVDYTVGGGLTAASGKKIFIMITTQPLISGFSYNAANLATRSRYVILTSGSNASFVFNNMHPGTYYAYAFCDNDGNGMASTGDYFSIPGSNAFTLNSKSSTNVSVQINYTL